MALVDTTWYLNSVGYAAVTVRPQNTAVAAGILRRQFTAPAVGSERVFACIVAGTTANTTDATWTLTRGAKTTDGSATWQEVTGQAGLNGDLTNTATWAQVKAATPAVLGQVIKRSSNASYQICTTAGAMSASEPAFSDTAGVTTTDTTAVWTSLGAVGNFTGGQAPHARLANVFGANWFASGNTVYVGDNHAETQSTTFTLSGSSALMAKILCHNHSGSYPPAAADLTTGATFTTSLNVSTAMAISPAGSFYFQGLAFIVSGSFGSITLGLSTVSQIHNWYYFKDCVFRIAGVGGTNFIQLGNAAAATWGTIIFDNTKVKFGHASQSMPLVICQFTWRNTEQILEAGSVVPTTLFLLSTNSSQFITMVLEALDLSQLTGSLFSNTTSVIGSLTVKDCKLNAATTVTTPINTGMMVQLAASDSGATSYKSSRHTYEAVETTETSIVRTGGYADPQGQQQSRKIVTTANTQWLRPYQAQPLAVWNATTGSAKTVTVYGTVNSGTLPTNDEIWLEVGGLTNASFPVGSTVTSGKANVWSAGSAGVSDSSTWGASYATLNGAASVGIVLTNGNLTATHGVSGNQFARGSIFIDSGKYYFEVLVQDSFNASNSIGLMLPTAAAGDPTSAGAPNCALMYLSGSIAINGVTTVVDVGTNAVGTAVRVAVDLTNHLIWFRIGSSGDWNANASYDPATGVGGLAIPAGSWTPFVAFTSTVVTNAVTVNFGASAYVYTPPSGFVDWGTITPFKLVATLTPQMAGYLIPQVKVAKASSTFYLDPLAVVT